MCRFNLALSTISYKESQSQILATMAYISIKGTLKVKNDIKHSFHFTFYVYFHLGSMVEGASLARLFHPDTKEGLEMEADIMYIVGTIDEQTAKECFQVRGKRNN